MIQNIYAFYSVYDFKKKIINSAYGYITILKKENLRKTNYDTCLSYFF